MLQQILQQAGPWLDSYGYAALFAVVFIEGFGIPAPGETMIIASGLLAYEGKVHILPVLLVAWAAAVAGDNLGFAIGHLGGRRLVLRFGSHVGVHAPGLQRVERFFDRYGGPVIALARFVDGPRQLNGLVAGSSGMRWWRFLAFNAIGAALWVGVWGGGVYLAGHRIEAALGSFKRVEQLFVILLLAAVVAFLGWRLWNRSRRHPG